MALVLVRLKLAIQRHTLGRGGPAQRAWFVLVWVAALVGGMCGGLLVAGAEDLREALPDSAVLLTFTAVFLAWITLPLIVPDSGDNSVDPETLAQYPLTAGQQVRGLLLAGMVGPGALFSFLVAGGGSFAADEDLAARLWVLLGAGVFAALCVAASRSLQALLASFLASNRGKAVTIAISTIIFLVVWLGSQAIGKLGESVGSLDSAAADNVLSALPPGAIGRASLLVRDGEWAQAALFLVYGVAGVLVFLLLWLWALRRQANGTSVGSGTRRSAGGPAEHTELYPAPLRWLPRNDTTASLAQQMRLYFFRAPRAVQGLVIGVVLGAVLGHSFVEDAESLGAAAGFFVLMICVQLGTNALGQDGTSFGYFVQTGADMRHVLFGKLLLLPLVALPAAMLFIVVEAALLGSYSTAAPALVAAVCVCLTAMGTGAVTSVLAPANLAEPGVGKAKRGRTVVLMLISTAGLLLVALVVGLLPAISEGDTALLWGALAAAAALTAVLSLLAIRWAGARLGAGQLEALDILGG